MTEPGRPTKTPYCILDLFDPKTMDLTAPTPYIPVHSPHFRYAALVVAGYTYREAGEELSIEPRKAKRWRERLRRATCRYLGRPVTYDFAARFALDTELRRVFHESRTAHQSEQNSGVQSDP